MSCVMNRRRPRRRRTTGGGRDAIGRLSGSHAMARCAMNRRRPRRRRTTCGGRDAIGRLSGSHARARCAMNRRRPRRRRTTGGGRDAIGRFFDHGNDGRLFATLFLDDDTVDASFGEGESVGDLERDRILGVPSLGILCSPNEDFGRWNKR
jgi:hypothetical protein